jgi:putative methyltransferase
MKNIVVYNPSRFSNEVWMPVLWAQAKTYYERNGQRVNEWTWAPSIADLHGSDLNKAKLTLGHIEPDVFAVSLYVWNYRIAHEIAKWVKSRWPSCLVITGGPHQYFKYNDDWFTKHPYIDASLPGESFGELCLQQILDNVDDDNNVDWNLISDICYPQKKSRYPQYSKIVSTPKDRQNFDYGWSVFHAQLDHFKNYINVAKAIDPTMKILSIIETTRGCPYGCTYCDWGGGINTKVLKKPIEVVKQDIDAVCQLDLRYLYFADANFGIFGDRDVEIIRYLAKQRRNNVQVFGVGYGGFAKTENKLPYIEKILKIDLKHGLSLLNEIKLSLQSLDADVLKIIDRKNVSLEKQTEMLKNIIPWYKKFPIYVELIYGLPGMTLEKFYHELNFLGKKKLSIQWYPWILLPEAPAYSRDYRNKYQLDTLLKTAGWWIYENETNNYNEIVVESFSYSKEQYLEMLMSSSLYKLFIQGGYLKNFTNWLNRDQGVGVGQLIQAIYQEFLPTTEFLDPVIQTWNNEILKDPTVGCFIKIQDQNVYLGLYMVAIAFLYHEEFTLKLIEWAQQRYNCPKNVFKNDIKLAIHQDNFGSKSTGVIRYNYKKKFYNESDNLQKMLVLFIHFTHSGHAIRGRRSFLL